MRQKGGEMEMDGVRAIDWETWGGRREEKRRMGAEKKVGITVGERWSGLERAFESWRVNAVRIVSAGIGAGGSMMQEGRHGQAVMLANLSSAVIGDGRGSRYAGGEGGPGIRLAYLPQRGTYAYEALQRRFQELDRDGLGYISEGELKVALKRLNLPASEIDVQSFMDHIVHTTQTNKVTFEQFAEYALQRENELLDTFKELDRRKIGYITEKELKAALQKYKFSLRDEDIAKLVNNMHGKGRMLGATQFYNKRMSFDFAEYRDFLMFSTAKDLRDGLEAWGPAVMDLGGVGSSFPLSPGKPGPRRPKHQVLKHLLIGGISGVASRTIVAPLARAKVLCMVNKEAASAGFINVLKTIRREEGITGFYKGNTLSIIRAAPKKVVEFLVYDKLKDTMLTRTNRIDLSGGERLLLGSLASVAAALLTHPIDTVRSAVMGQFGKQGNVEVIKAIVNQQGWMGFFKGVGPHMVRVAPYGAVNFFVYDKLEQLYRKKAGPGGKIGPIPTICFGALAGAAAQTVVHPLEMVQRRLQAQASKQGPVLYNNLVHAFQVIIREEGAGAVYAGLLPSYAMILPAAAVSFLVYESLKGQVDLSP